MQSKLYIRPRSERSKEDLEKALKPLKERNDYLSWDAYEDEPSDGRTAARLERHVLKREILELQLMMLELDEIESQKTVSEANPDARDLSRLRFLKEQLNLLPQLEYYFQFPEPPMTQLEASEAHKALKADIKDLKIEKKAIELKALKNAVVEAVDAYKTEPKKNVEQRGNPGFFSPLGAEEQEVDKFQTSVTSTLEKSHAEQQVNRMLDGEGEFQNILMQFLEKIMEFISDLKLFNRVNESLDKDQKTSYNPFS